MKEKFRLTWLMILAGLATKIYAQAVNHDVLVWNEYYELQWRDYKGVRGPDARGDAGTAVKIKATPFRVKNKIRYTVEAIFIRSKSWVSDPSDQLLLHERLHFHIAELYARKIRKRVKELNEQSVSDIKVYNAAIRELLDESNGVDIQYDAETLHGALLKKQKMWDEKVKAELLLLAKYKKQKHTLSAGG
jgi:hypothetical protein